MERALPTNSERMNKYGWPIDVEVQGNIDAQMLAEMILQRANETWLKNFVHRLNTEYNAMKQQKPVPFRIMHVGMMLGAAQHKLGLIEDARNGRRN
jgi:hypothetical protein